MFRKKSERSKAVQLDVERTEQVRQRVNDVLGEFDSVQARIHLRNGYRKK